jgi:hypothetical protein
LPDGAAFVAEEPWDIHRQFDPAAADREHLEDPRCGAEPDDVTRLAARTLQRVRMAEYCDTLQSKEKRDWEYKACLNERANRDRGLFLQINQVHISIRVAS